MRQHPWRWLPGAAMTLERLTRAPEGDFDQQVARATSMGTDWTDNDPEVEPLVEIFQGDRNSYEQPGAPLTDRPDDLERQLRSTGAFVSNALAKGYRLGFIASSGHVSTHLFVSASRASR
jgi:hypothetical protein